MEYGLQLFSVRKEANENYGEMLRSVAEMGYSFVEIAGFCGHTAKEVRAMADAYGLKVSSTHIAFRELFENFDNTVKYHKELGCSDIVLPWGSFFTAPEVEYYIDGINKCLPKLKEEGMRLHYHNHAAEFFPNQDGVIAMSEYIDRTDIMLEMDCYWICVAGLDPVKFMEEYNDRISIIHLKDGMLINPHEPYSSDIGRSLGLGEIPINAVRAKAIELGKTIIVESEACNPTGLEEVRRCIDYLRQIDK